MIFPLSLFVIFVKDAAPSPATVGTAYSVAHLVHCVALAIAPGFSGMLFSFSADSGWFGGYFLWLFMLDYVNVPYHSFIPIIIAL